MSPLKNGYFRFIVTFNVPIAPFVLLRFTISTLSNKAGDVGATTIS